MSAMAFQITCAPIVYPTVCSGADQGDQKLRVTSLREVNSPVTGEFPAQRVSKGEMFLFDDVIMIRAVWERYAIS